MSIPLQHYKNRDRILIVEAGKLHPALSFSRASTATYINGVGTLVTAAANVPRFEYSTAGVYLGLLIEESRTNLIKQSQALGTTPWSSVFLGTGVSPITTANAAVSPDGTTTATRIQLNKGVGTTVNDYAAVGQTVSVTSGSIYSLSEWVKANGAGEVGKIIIIRGVNASYLSVTLTANWQRVVQTIATTSTSALITSATLRGALGSSNNADSFIWGCQYELGASATSYIPATTAAVTRSADVAQATLSTIGISTTAGTFVIEHDAPSGAPLLYSGSNAILVSTGAGKVAIAYDGSGIMTSVNGAATTTGSALTFSTTLDIGKSTTTSANAHIKRLVWYRTKRANSELRGLST